MKLFNSMNIPNAIIMPIFPTPIISYEIEMEEEERLFLLGQYPDNVRANVGNLISKNTNILKNKNVELLEQKLSFCVNDAFNRIHNPRYGCELYITQSWLNFTGKSQNHHLHSHPNSIFSAVLYLKATEEDMIVFHHPSHNHNYDIITNRYDVFNSKSWQMPVKENLLLIFPSTLFHSVPDVGHDGLRVSMSFNTFIRGQIGETGSLNLLEL